ncbi:MAG: MSHA biogenesis protein MshK [Prevotella sp.]|nr:MAG: MSHA biogenesis protein MshK [Prevotella sp.]
MVDYPVSLRHIMCTKLRIYFTITLKRMPDFDIINGHNA